MQAILALQKFNWTGELCCGKNIAVMGKTDHQYVCQKDQA